MTIHWQAASRTISGLVLVLLSFAMALPGCGGDPHPAPLRVPRSAVWSSSLDAYWSRTTLTKTGLVSGGGVNIMNVGFAS